MASPAYQESGFQNFTDHGIKGFQVTDSDTGVPTTGAFVQIHHYYHPVLALLSLLPARSWL